MVPTVPLFDDSSLIKPKTNQNYPLRQHWRHAKLNKKSSRKMTRQKVNNQRPLHRWYACLSSTSKNATFSENVNKTPKWFNWCAVLSKTESGNLIGQKTNKVSCITSVSHKLIHATKRGRHFFLKTRKRKRLILEVSPGKNLPKRTNKLRRKHLTCLGHETESVRNLQKTYLSRSVGLSKAPK